MKGGREREYAISDKIKSFFVEIGFEGFVRAQLRSYISSIQPLKSPRA